VAGSYHRLYNRNMYADMQGELQSTEYNEMLSIVAEKPQKAGKRTKPVLLTKKYEEWAKRLKAAFDKTYGPLPGTDEDAIKTVFAEIPTQADFVQVSARYKMLYGTKLDDDLKSESEFGQYSDWMKIITSKP
jgi:isochorismate hydrolase